MIIKIFELVHIKKKKKNIPLQRPFKAFDYVVKTRYYGYEMCQKTVSSLTNIESVRSNLQSARKQRLLWRLRNGAYKWCLKRTSNSTANGNSACK